MLVEVTLILREKTFRHSGPCTCTSVGIIADEQIYLAREEKRKRGI